MQVILDSLFSRQGSAPIWSGKKGEFRDWTRKPWMVCLPRWRAVKPKGDCNNYLIIMNYVTKKSLVLGSLESGIAHYRQTIP